MEVIKLTEPKKIHCGAKISIAPKAGIEPVSIYKIIRI